MSTAAADAILADLRRVDHERRARAADAGLAAAVVRVKAYQQKRFETTYADLLADPRYAAAARFFLQELYGPHDFTQRDAQFARIVPGLVRLFPREVVDTVTHLAALHALSEELDTLMGRALGARALDRAVYVELWQHVGRAHDRKRQIELMHRVGLDLDAYTRNPLLRHSLRMMRAPARLAGLDALQRFLESGFDTFRAMRGAQSFLATIVRRETSLAERLFAAADATAASADDPLGQLP
ncbi:hypothetical protein MOJ79_00715 [Calidifontimicrobium sp. SYSU G02091]|uniref:FFLEELY motif protein n=1 Tax=Calidifontimicrobium sp. SYSU G02091 TaxID=2926421 RepID=UPI001F53870F|nr:hypothetical protein [Calidifontimicrobium sp. SYSU G02091]MCI1190361.1 hypothetical protein [Calidifontimicrobium sp. SYSU G02091]